MGESNDRLRLVRKRAGFTSAAKAVKRFGWVYSTYLSHENGQTPVPVEEAETYAKAFKVPGGASWIIYGDDGPKAGPKKNRLVAMAEKVPPEQEPLAIQLLEVLMRPVRRP